MLLTTDYWLLTKRIQGATTRNADRLLFVGVRPISGVGRYTLEIPLSLSCRSMDIRLGAMEYPREPSTKTRLPHRQKPHCEAPTGVADPITTWSSEVDASTQEGG